MRTIGAFYVPGIPYCTECFERNDKFTESIAIFPPKNVLFRRLAFGCLTYFALIAIVAGGVFLFKFLANQGMLEVAIAMVVLICLGFLAGMFWFVTRAQHIGNELWRDYLITRFALEDAIRDFDLKADLAIFVDRKPSLFDMKLPMHIGVLLHNSEGMVFVAGEQKAFALPASQLEDVDWHRLIMFPPRKGLKLSLSSSSIYGAKSVYLAIKTESNFSKNTDKTRSILNQLIARSKELAAGQGDEIERSD